MTSERESASTRILHVFPSFEYGGVPIRMSRVINDLGPVYSHAIVALDGCLDSRSRIEPSLAVRYPTVEPVKGNPLKAVLQARREIAGSRPDLVMTYNWGAVEWAMAASLVGSCRQIHCESGFGVEEANGQIARRVLFRRLALRRIARLIVPSQTLLRIACDSWKIPRAKVTQIANGVDLARFAGPADPQALAALGLSPASDDLLVGTAAPLRPEKNVARLLRAFAQLPTSPKAKLAIFGEGAERPRLEALADSLGIADRVVFAGHVEALERVLGALDLFVLSSDTEQMPNSLIQAMAAGLPVAATAVGDLPVMLPEAQRSYLAPVTDEGALTRAMAALLADPSLRARIGQENRDCARRHHDEGEMVERYRTAISECVSSGP